MSLFLDKEKSQQGKFLVLKYVFKYNFSLTLVLYMSWGVIYFIFGCALLSGLNISLWSGKYQFLGELPISYILLQSLEAKYH